MSVFAIGMALAGPVRAHAATPATTQKELAVASRTAIVRHGGAFAVPIRMLLDKKLISGTVLHHGCGKDVAGSEAMRKYAKSVTDYDPTFAPNPKALSHRYDTVVSNYVLNVLPPAERERAVADIAHSTRTRGTAFVTVRAAGDHAIVGKPEQDGVRTSHGTFQKGFTFEQLKAELAPHFGKIVLLAGSDRSSSLTVAASERR